MAGNLLVYEGNLVKANDTTPLVTITQATPIYVTFAVPEGELAKVNRARAAGSVRVEAALPSDEAHPVAGVLSFVDNAVDSTTGTIRLKATYDNPDRRLWPGQFVKVVLTTGVEADALVVPAQAIQTGQDGPYVYIVKDDMTVEPRPVKTGPSSEGLVAISKGLAAGERVVTDGQLRLFPGAKVELKTKG
jgi:multidrug efflux system membrane fusion protein